MSVLMLGASYSKQQQEMDLWNMVGVVFTDIAGDLPQQQVTFIQVYYYILMTLPQVT